MRRHREIVVAPVGQTLLFEAGSIGALKDLQVEGNLRPGSTFTIEMRLKTFFPFAKAFDLPGAELIFKRVMPDGLQLIDVKGEGFHTVFIETRVRGTPLAGVGLFIAAHWVGLSLATIGIAFALGFLVNSIRGKGVLGDGGLPGVDDLRMLGFIALGIGVVVLLARR